VSAPDILGTIFVLFAIAGVACLIGDNDYTFPYFK
jgi:hypothetical protein